MVWVCMHQMNYVISVIILAVTSCKCIASVKCLSVPLSVSPVFFLRYNAVGHVVWHTHSDLPKDSTLPGLRYRLVGHAVVMSIQWNSVELNIWWKCRSQFSLWNVLCSDMMALCFMDEGSVEKCQLCAASWLAEWWCHWAEELQHTLPTRPWAGSQEHHLQHPVWWKGNCYPILSSEIMPVTAENARQLVAEKWLFIFEGTLATFFQVWCTSA